MTRRVLAFTRYGSLAASTRQRIRIYEPALREAGFAIDYAPLLDDDHIRRLVEGQKTPLPTYLRAYATRLADIVRARRYDLVWVHYELFPFLPLERIARIIGRPIIVDYDDATFHRYDNGTGISHLLRGKLEPLLRYADACVCGNAYLRDYAAQFCCRVVVVPTIVDTDHYRPATESPDRSVIGWIGSPSTWANVRPLLPLLESVCDRFDARLRVVGAGHAANGDQFARMDCVAWSEASEIADVQAMTIGIMPLIEAPFERGKCGYKLIQYMACGLPVVASPVGVNREIVRDGENGFLATEDEEWAEALGRLLGDETLRRTMGERSRKRAVEDYSLATYAPRLVDLFRSVAAAR